MMTKNVPAYLGRVVGALFKRIILRKIFPLQFSPLDSVEEAFVADIQSLGRFGAVPHDFSRVS